MSQDASFEDGRETALNLGALGQEDLQVLSTLVQDAVFPATEIIWHASQRRFAILLNRFRWEDPALAAQGSQAAERVQTVLAIGNVLAVASQGIDRTDTAMIFSVLSIKFDGAEDEAGVVLLTLAGDGAIRLSVEALEVQLKDVTRPYTAPSKTIPDHGS
jgi:hypothetical protein